MARLRSVVAALSLLAVLSLAGPSSVFGCSCVAGMTMADVKASDAAVFVGTVGADHGNGVFDFAVERWFRGGAGAIVPVQSAQTRMADGSFAINSCGLNLKLGEHLFLAAPLVDGVYVPNSCLLNANADNPEGQTLVADAAEVFGPGAPPGEQPGGDPEPGIPFFGIAIAGGLLILLVGGVMIVARRERA